MSVSAQSLNVTIVGLVSGPLAHRLRTSSDVGTRSGGVRGVPAPNSLLLPSEELLALTRKVPNEGVPRSSVSRCLRRHGGGNSAALKPKAASLVHESSKNPCARLRAHGHQVSGANR